MKPKNDLRHIFHKAPPRIKSRSALEEMRRKFQADTEAYLRAGGKIKREGERG